MSTINKEEIEKFSKLSEEWWDPSGKFAPLHKLNPIRLEFIKTQLILYFRLNEKSQEPLGNLDILDIGCGGGILSEPISRLGANVTGMDAAKKNINVAKIHSKQMGLKINYINSSPENFKGSKKFDVILNMEIIEHVLNPDLFVKSCAKLLKKNGIMFVATINRTLKSYLFAIIGAEYILRWLPIGTHDWNNFFTPEELKKLHLNNNFLSRDLIGIKFNPLSQDWTKSTDTSINYISTFIKN